MIRAEFLVVFVELNQVELSDVTIAVVVGRDTACS
jgi:hypothetical protein